VSHMAIYHHVSGKRRLQELVADAVLARVALPDPAIADWVERLTQSTISFRDELLRYPGLAEFVIHEHHVTDAARPLYEQTILTLLEAGFTPVQAALGREALFSLAPYYLTHTAVTRGGRPKRRRGARSRWSPEVQDALDQAAEVDALERYSFANRILLEGLRAQLEAAPARKATRTPAKRSPRASSAAGTSSRAKPAARRTATR